MYRLEDVNYMTEALRLAREGTGLASPNPRVGAVVVKDGHIVGRGTHRYAEAAHAEVLALLQAGAAARGAALYLNLEPCCHTGRTSPCTEAVIGAGVARVVAAMTDPNPRVAGAGLRALAAAGIAVDCGCMEREARTLNEDFAQWVGTGLPFVTLKAATSLDGRIAGGGGPRWLSSAAARARVQQMRHERDALLVGIGTVLADNPRLTDRTKRPRRRPLLRCVLDTHLRIPLESELVRRARRDQGLTIVCGTAAHAENRDKVKALEKAGVAVQASAAGPRLELGAVLRWLASADILSVLLEGGAILNGQMLAGGWVDKIVLFQAPLLLGDSATPLAAGLAGPPLRPLAGPVSAECVGADVMIEAYLAPPSPCSPV